jgi:chemosensory pili system protein ChpA (sensor histidine kinase/response regulator)
VRRQPCPPADRLIDAIQNFSHPATPKRRRAASGKTEACGAAADAGADMVKVSAELLDDLVNLAGETSIFPWAHRAAGQRCANRPERDGNHHRAHARSTAPPRHRNPGRILSRQQVDAERLGYEEFDPLEMDRHSQLQQLSRALFESASDLLDLKETLDRRNQAGNLLQQQGRINTELQEGLMRTRMVPFERMLPRLKRIVRQVAEELGKDVFIVGNAEGEMDRNVLERMAAPLEHMLRNAVDHGLESAVRLAAGKPAQGTSPGLCARAATSFSISATTAPGAAGGGAAQGDQARPARPDAEISDRDVLQFILQPGFSTAEKITQISGRGVGMDVVHEEVRQLGGS